MVDSNDTYVKVTEDGVLQFLGKSPLTPLEDTSAVELGSPLSFNGGGGGEATLIEKTITSNGTYNASSDNADGYSSVTVNVANSYTAGDEGKVVSSGALVAQTARAATITENGTYTTTTNNEVTVNVPSSSYLTELSAVIERSNNTNLTIPSGTTRIGKSAFGSWTGLTSVTIPSSVTSIGESAFGNTGLTTVTIHDSVTSLGNYAFYQCSHLTSVTIGSGITNTGSNTFNSCTSLNSVTFPNTIRVIDSQCFMSCRGLTSITIPDSVTHIGQNAFNSCTGLTSVTIGSGITTIFNTAFAGDTNITDIYIDKTEGSVSGAPWGATNATVHWTGT